MRQCKRFRLHSFFTCIILFLGANKMANTTANTTASKTEQLITEAIKGFARNADEAAKARALALGNCGTARMNKKEAAAVAAMAILTVRSEG
jgi:hypothetical protein